MHLQKVISTKTFFSISFLLESWKSMTKIRIPDPLVRGMDPRIRIHTKMSWTWNTGFNSEQGPPLSSLSDGSRYLAQCSGGCVPLGPARPVLGEVLELRDAGQLRHSVLPLLALLTSQHPLLLTPHVRQQVCNMGDGNNDSVDEI